MLDREACERRVYRLATLLTGNPRLATTVITAVVDAQPDLSRLDGAHMDRLTVLRSREIVGRSPGVLHGDFVPDDAARALAALPMQQREAWVFGRIYRIPVRDMSRAMDCSVTATQRHLEMADASMVSALNNRAVEAAESLLQYSMTLDVPAFYRVQQRRRRLIRRVLWTALVAIILLAALAVALWWRART